MYYKGSRPLLLLLLVFVLSSLADSAQQKSGNTGRSLRRAYTSQFQALLSKTSTEDLSELDEETNSETMTVCGVYVALLRNIKKGCALGGNTGLETTVMNGSYFSRCCQAHHKSHSKECLKCFDNLIEDCGQDNMRCMDELVQETYTSVSKPCGCAKHGQVSYNMHCGKASKTCKNGRAVDVSMMAQ